MANLKPLFIIPLLPFVEVLQTRARKHDNNVSDILDAWQLSWQYRVKRIWDQSTTISQPPGARWCECAFLDWFSCFADCCSLHERCQLVSYSPSICETVKNTTQTVATSRHLPGKLQVTKAITKSFLVQHHRYRWLQLATWCHDTLPVWLGKGQMMLHTC